MPKLIALLGVLLVGTMSYSQPASTIKKLDSVLTQLSARRQFNGTVLYAEQGRVLFKKAFGFSDFRSGQALLTTSAFNLASITKQFVDVCILQLYEQGRVQLDAPVKKYIPELPYEGITVRQLMTHTSGIPEYFGLFTQYKGALDTLDNESMIRLFARYHPPLDFKSGTAWQYCNTNYVLLVSIIERVSRLSFHDYFHQHIALPLGLTNSYIYHVRMPVVPANHVLGFRQENGQAKLFDLTNVDGVTGDGNAYSSVEDLYKWEQSLYGEKLLREESLAQAFQPVKLADGSTYPYGFGWFIAKGNQLLWHTGSWQGFKNLIYRDIVNHRTLIVLSSGEDATGRAFAKALFEGKDFPIPRSRLITNVMVIDGMGTPRREAAVRIEGNIIREVGKLSPFPQEEVIDGRGKVLAPGFIDTHSHVGGSLEEFPEAIADLNQGVTTIVVGQDGFSTDIDSIKARLGRRPIAVNLATYTGHSSLREEVLGADQLKRPATGEELEKMKELLNAEMKKGSLGLSSGLEYEQAYFSTRDEVLQLARVSAAAHGRYISHLRSEDFELPNALDEIIGIGREARLPVQISHLKIALKDDWHTASDLLAKLESARREGIDITADCYPYEYWHSTLKVLFPKTDYTNPVSAEFAVNHTFDPKGSVVDKFAADPRYEGKTLSEIAAMRQETPARALMHLISAADSFTEAHPEVDEVESIDGKSMADDDVVNFLSWANSNICSDGANGGHPRGFGSFTRVLGYYVRERRSISLETAIHKMSGLAADHMGLKGRGLIAPGYFADLVLLDPATVMDHSTIQNPKALSSGIGKVWVNGIVVYEREAATGQYPGQFLSR